MTFKQRDEALIWHPFHQYALGQSFPVVTHAQGSVLFLEDGRQVIDATSSWWVNLHGHSHPRIVQALKDQAEKLDHVLFGSFTHPPAIELAERILSHPAVTSSGLKKIFYSDNGSTAVEVALKIAYQHFQNRGEKKRQRFLALKGAYHGDTFGAMAVGDRQGYHQIFDPLLLGVDFVAPEDLGELEERLRNQGQEYAAFIVEPLVQGANEMRFYSRAYLNQAVTLCQSVGIPVICDEVFTGFFRTGTLFAYEQAEIKPDLVCLSKGITGGVLPLGATLVKDEFFQSFISKDMKKTFYHGHSYTGNPLTCAVAVASWDLLHEEASLKQIKRIESETQAHIERLKSHPNVKDARSIGVLGVVEMKHTSRTKAEQVELALNRGVSIRPLGQTLYSLPPYCTSSEQLDLIYEVILELLG